MLLQDIRVWASIASTAGYSIIISGFNATLPIYLYQVFHWDSAAVGTAFFVLQVPTIFLSPVSGWIRDRAGLRYPTTIGWALLIAPMLCLGGVPDLYPGWISALCSRDAVVLSCLTSIGAILPFIQGVGAVNTLSEF